MRENILTRLKIVENLFGNNDRNTTNTPIIDKTKQKNDFNINNSNWQIAHSSKSGNKRQRGSKDIHFETSSKSVPLLTEKQIMSQNVVQQIWHWLIQRNPIPSNWSVIFKEKEDQISASLKIKNFTPVAVAGNSNYASISKNGRKILVVGDSHVKRIRRIDFNKVLK